MNYSNLKWKGAENWMSKQQTKELCSPSEFRGVLRKRCFENMQQLYRRTPMPKCEFNTDAKQLYWNHTSLWVFSCKFAVYFQTTFSQEHLWTAASVLLRSSWKYVRSINELVSSLHRMSAPLFSKKGVSFEKQYVKWAFGNYIKNSIM